MAKDILVNTQSGDLIMSDESRQAVYFSTVWGKVFDSDENEFLNIIVPNNFINHINLINGEYSCYISASYHPSNSYFLVRLLVVNSATGEYQNLSEYNSFSPMPTGCVYYPVFGQSAEYIKANQLPLMNRNGQYRIVFKAYGQSNFTRAIIYSADEFDFKIGESDSQSVQLLARCAPGKFYRYPTTGVDLTKYINSVVPHTDLAGKMQSEFSADGKNITMLDFVSKSGDLDIEFVGTKEADDTNLTDPSLLDIEVFRIADDDFVKDAITQTVEIDEMEYVGQMAVFGWDQLFDIGNMAELDYDDATEAETGSLDGDGNVIEDESGYIVTKTLVAETMYAIDMDEIEMSELTPESALVAAYVGDTVIYSSDPSMYGDSDLERGAWQGNYGRRCLIPRSDVTIKYRIDRAKEEPDHGIFKVKIKKGNYRSILGYKTGEHTGRLCAIVSADSIITDVMLDIETNQIIALMSNE